MARKANRFRKKQRPDDPIDLAFELNEQYMPDGFFRKDVHVGPQRHLIFATQKQLDLLARAKRWYVDGTFKVVREPFTQLWSIHAFVSYDGVTKQIPLVYVLMSSRKKKDYKKVLKAVLDILSDDIALEEIMTDFEKAFWKAAEHVIPDVTLRGCGFHWNQAVWRKVQAIGLSPSYLERGEVYTYIRQLMALPFLPEEHIAPVFERLARKASTDKLQQLVGYMRDTWVTSSTWPPTSWTVFGQPVRTNNDVEGYHSRLNKKGYPHMPFYLLIVTLHDESSYATLQVELLSSKKLVKYQKKTYKRTHSIFIKLWKDYSDGEISVKQLLHGVARVNGPVIV